MNYTYTQRTKLGFVRLEGVETSEVKFGKEGKKKGRVFSSFSFLLFCFVFSEWLVRCKRWHDGSKE